MPMTVSAKGRRFMNMYALTKQFAAFVPSAEKAAAAEATSVSRATFQSLVGHRPIAPARSRRPSTEGQFATDILWEVTANARLGNVTLDINRMPPYVFIQEVGTGHSVRILNPVGVVSIRSQVGREINGNLYWASGPGGNAETPRGGATDAQLYFGSQLNAASVSARPRRKMRIKREIRGKHFIARGGEAGFLELSTSLTDEAKRIFR